MFDYSEDDFSQEFDRIQKRMMRRILKEIQNLEDPALAGQPLGNWSVKQIDRPGVKGYTIQGRFQYRSPQLDSKTYLNEKREPLTDIFEEEENIKIYVELPGVDKKDISLNATDRLVEINAKNFSKKIRLPTVEVDLEKISAKYRNGVLQVTLPRTATGEGDKKKRFINIQ